MRLSDTAALLLRLPEVSALAALVENNDWHDDDVLQQSLRLAGFVVGLPDSLRGVTGSVSTSVRTMLLDTTDFGSYTTQDLLVLAALIHDVGKAETFENQPDGSTRCPGHEVAGARIAPALCARFALTSHETEFVAGLVAGQGVLSELFKRTAPLPMPEREERLRRFEDNWGDDLLPLLLLTYGDLVTSQLESRHPEKYAVILTFYQAWLGRLLGRLAEDGSTEGS